MTTLAEQVAEVKVGDWVEATWTFDDAEIVANGRLTQVHDCGLEIRGMWIRFTDNKLHPFLTSITRVPRPIPSEPKVGSFALTDIEGHVAQRKVYEDRDVWIRSASGGKPHRYSWPEIYPHIVRLYTPSGDEVTGFEYAGERK